MGSENKICFLFQSTHPRRVWRTYLEIRCAAWCFNPHTHKGVTVQHHRRGRWLLVSIHTPTKGVTHYVVWYKVLSRFQSTHPRRVWLITVCGQDLPNLFQSTHPRRVWLRNNFAEDLNILFQSTHPRRVWPMMPGFLAPSISFQSTHPRRVWRRVEAIWKTMVRFNPHTHEGCDTFRSIGSVSYRCFNPHTHEGCDPSRPGCSPHADKFQSTHPRRVWHLKNHTVMAVNQFQSTHPRRVWLANSYSFVSLNKVSIHTPTKGVTKWSLAVNRLPRCFNPHTHEGCDLGLRSQSVSVACFNPHTHEGCDVKPFRGLICVLQFQSTHPRRVWRWGLSK